MEPELFTPSIDWAVGAAGFAALDRQGLGHQRRCLLVVLVVLRYVTVWGRQFWRITRGYFVGPQSVRVWLMLGVLLLSVVVVGAARRAVQLLLQRLVHQPADGVRGYGSRQRGRRTVWNTRILGVDRRVQHLGGSLRHREADAGHVPDPAFHHRVARLADRPSHRRLARRSGLLPRPVHRRHHRQPRPAHPAGHRHLHRRQRRRDRTSRPTEHAAPCCSAPSSGGLGDFVHRDPVESVGSADLLRRHSRQGDVLDRASSTCWSRPSSRSGWAVR